MDPNKQFLIDNTSRTRSNGVKLRCKQIQLDSTELFFAIDVVMECNKLQPSLVPCDTINSFYNKLHHLLLNQGILQE